MFAEHTLGLADYLFRRATSKNVGFLGSNVKSMINFKNLYSCILTQLMNEIQFGYECQVCMLQINYKTLKIKRKRISLQKKLRCIVEMEDNL